MLDEDEWKSQFDKEPAFPPEDAYTKHNKMLIEYAKLTDEQKKAMLRETLGDIQVEVVDPTDIRPKWDIEQKLRMTKQEVKDIYGIDFD